MTYDDFTFFGILHDFNFNSYSNENLTNIVIEKNIYFPIEKDELQKINLSEHSFSHFSKNFFYNNTYYKLNPKITIELFYYYLMQLKISEIKTSAYFINSIETRINGIDNKNDVIKILKKCRKKIVQKSIDYVLELDDFINLVDENIREKEGFESIIYYSFNGSEIENYLSFKIISNEGAFFKKWKKLQSQNVQINYYNKKIVEIVNLKSSDLNLSIEKNPLNKIIFKENAEKIFSFFVTKYPKTKNTAFFSYLYFYLRDKLSLLQVIGNDNKDYRDYITELFQITFSRIQNTTSQNQYKKNEIFDLFDKYIEEYYSLNSDTNLSKNE